MRWVLWWFAVLSAYVIEFVTQVASEVVAGIIIAGLCTIIVGSALLSAKPGVRVHWSWLKYLLKVPAAMLRDALLVSGRILWALRSGQQLVGMIERVPYDPGDRQNELDQGREAIAIFGVNAAPNTVVADVDLRGELVIHKLIAREQPRRSRQWPL